MELTGELNVDSEAFQQCLTSGEMQQHVLADYQNGIAARVSDSPANFIVHHQSGEVTVLMGAVPYGRLEAAMKRQFKSQE